ncbi:MAG: hypothetical protein P1U47_00650 [Zhongshania sp.]|uniref:hypothetical protein n=1 Tax=Zhongshania sp. TaxID=1971902 RepID=UPI00260EEC6A|nr:hypothetical protein [Zhongshania sp.]MDF1690852.1 hypothetical protein [Zhongshania sp.]
MTIKIKRTLAILALAMSSSIIQSQEIPVVSGLLVGGNMVGLPMLGGGMALLSGSGERLLNGDPLQIVSGLGNLGVSALNPDVALGLFNGTALPLIGVVSPTLTVVMANPVDAIDVLLNKGGLLAPGTASLPTIPLLTAPLLGSAGLPTL